MKLDINCVRDLLTELETLDMGCFGIDSFPKSLKKHSEKQITYTFAKLVEAGYVMGDIPMDESGHYHFNYVCCMMYPGHQLIDQVRDEKRWGAVKAVLSSVRDYSLSAITAASEGMTKAAIERVLNDLDGGVPIISQ